MGYNGGTRENDALIIDAVRTAVSMFGFIFKNFEEKSFVNDYFEKENSSRYFKPIMV